MLFIVARQLSMNNYSWNSTLPTSRHIDELIIKLELGLCQTGAVAKNNVTGLEEPCWALPYVRPVAWREGEVAPAAYGHHFQGWAHGRAPHPGFFDLLATYPPASSNMKELQQQA